MVLLVDVGYLYICRVGVAGGNKGILCQHELTLDGRDWKAADRLKAQNQRKAS